MRVLFTVEENYLSETDRVIIRLNALLLKHIEDDKYTPSQEFCIDFEKDVTLEISELADRFETFAKHIRNHATT